MRYASLSLVFLAASALPIHAVRAQSVFESFETGFGDWTVDSHIMSVQPEQFIYTVTRSQAQAQDGVWSLEFFMDGSNDDGSVWIARTVDLPAGLWDVAVDFQVWVPVASETNIWPRIAFIDTFQPQVESDFAFIDPLSLPAGWSPFTYSRTIDLSSPQQVWVALGLRVTWEGDRTYYVDSVTVSWTPAACDDGTCDVGENPCNCPGDCPGEEPSETTCNDGVDNDCDSFVDCEDTSCQADPFCLPHGIPAISSWGVSVLTLLVFVAATLMLRRGKPIAARFTP